MWESIILDIGVAIRPYISNNTSSLYVLLVATIDCVLGFPNHYLSRRNFSVEATFNGNGPLARNNTIEYIARSTPVR